MRRKYHEARHRAPVVYPGITPWRAFRVRILTEWRRRSGGIH